jgi:hypothetical protein
MKIQPRQQLLEIWGATVRATIHHGEWRWGGRGGGGNSISDAEQLLCIMLPATEIPGFRLDRPDVTDADVLSALHPLGDRVAIPRRMIAALTDFMRKYQDENGIPRFPGGSYVGAEEDSPSSDPLQSPDVVESFSVSLTLTLATLGFCKVFLTSLSRPELIKEVTELETLSRRRLTAALTGLLRSFAINVFPPDTVAGRNLLRTINQATAPETAVLERVQRALEDVRAGLRDYITVGSGQNEDLDPSRLFECGWSWGTIEKAPKIDFVDEALQRDGLAINAPYLYFTVVALDGIADLFSARTRLLGLLDEEQQRLARALQIRWEHTQAYWAVIGSFGEGRWPLEDIPWRTVDDEESDYFTLLVTAIVARDLAQRPDPDIGLSRLGRVLGELANRGRLTARPYKNDDPAMLMHTPGVRIALELESAVEGFDLHYSATDFAPLLLKRIIRVAALINRVELRQEVLDLADAVWASIARRRLREGTGRGLWDQPGNVYESISTRYDQPTWHHTLRVVESLVFAAGLVATHPLRSDPLSNLTQDLLAEAEHLFTQEQLAGSTEAGAAMRRRLTIIQHRLERARQIASDKPGTSLAITIQVLNDIDELDAARSDVGND